MKDSGTKTDFSLKASSQERSRGFECSRTPRIAKIGDSYPPD